MSAPSAAICRACAIATLGSMNWPPSENESGVTLSTPMTNGLPFASSAGRFCGAVVSAAGAFMRVACAVCRKPSSSQNYLRSVGYFERQGLGVVDPARNLLLRGQNPHQLARLVG